MTAAEATSGAVRRGSRLAVIDIVRGIAILAMIVYHFAWDLSAHRLIDLDVAGELAWTAFARIIAGTFLLLVGVNLVLATRRGFRLAPYLRRLAVIVAAAAIVSLGTWWFVPDAFVFFGILHEIAVASVLALPFLSAPVWLTGIAALFFLAGPQFFASAFFDAPGWLWLGLAESPPTTVDYVPLFPWFGVVLAGVIGGRLIASHGDAPLWHVAPTDPASRFLIFAGRWSLPIYLVHQPVLLGILFVIAPLIGPGDAVLSGRFLNECQASCAADGYDRRSCDSHCGCVLSGLQASDNLLAAGENGALTEADRTLWLGHVNRCAVEHLPVPAAGGGT